MPSPASRPSHLTRRGFLLASAGLLVAAACGGDDDDAATTNDGDDGEASEFSLATFFPKEIAIAGAALRLPIGVTDKDGVLLDNAPAKLDVRLTGQGVDETFQLDRHNDGIPRSYYPLKTQFAEPGGYNVELTFEGGKADGTIEVVKEGKLPVPRVGQPLPAMGTPTTKDGHGVKPICTREPVCPLHDVTLEQALGAGKPVAFLVSTPAHCQLSICGPVLELLLKTQPEFGDRVKMLHAEVYADDSLQKLAPAVQTLHLTYEPVLFLADAGGVITSRLDTVYDAKELRDELQKLVGA